MLNDTYISITITEESLPNCLAYLPYCSLRKSRLIVPLAKQENIALGRFGHTTIDKHQVLTNVSQSALDPVRIQPRRHHRRRQVTVEGDPVGQLASDVGASLNAQTI